MFITEDNLAGPNGQNPSVGRLIKASSIPGAKRSWFRAEDSHGTGPSRLCRCVPHRMPRTERPQTGLSALPCLGFVRQEKSPWSLRINNPQGLFFLAWNQGCSLLRLQVVSNLGCNPLKSREGANPASGLEARVPTSYQPGRKSK